MRLFLLLCFPAASGAGSFHREGGGSAGGAKQVEGAADGLLAGFFAYRQYAGGSSPGNEAAKSKWAWRGHYQDSHTLLKLAEKPNAGTTKALQRGRRHVDERLSLIKSHLNLKGKSVLELGSNLGMNLLELRGSLSWAVGCDVNALAVNQANYLASVLDVGKAFRFYTFNLNTEPASVLQTFLPGGRADVLFIFSVNAYVDNFAKLPTRHTGGERRAVDLCHRAQRARR